MSMRITGICERCSSPLESELCTDETCPFSDHGQACPVGWVGHDEHPEADEDTRCGHLAGCRQLEL